MQPTSIQHSDRLSSMHMALATKTTRKLGYLDLCLSENVLVMSKLEHTCVDFVHSTDEIGVFISQLVIPAFQIGVKAHNISMNEHLIGRAYENHIVIDALPD